MKKIKEIIKKIREIIKMIKNIINCINGEMDNRENINRPRDGRSIKKK
jgi:hypothetical protein